MLKTICLAVTAIISLIVNAQVTSEIRKEFDLKETDATRVLVLGKKGMITFGTSKERGQEALLEINKFDTNMELVSTVESEGMSKAISSLVTINADTSKVYFYYEARNGREVLINIYDIASNSVSSHTQKLEKSFYPSGLTIVNGILMLSGSSGKKATFLTIEPISGSQQMTEMPGQNKKRFLESFVRDESGNSVTILYRDGANMKTSTLFLTILDANANLSTPIELDRDERYSIIDGSITWLNATDFILSGTYGTKNSSLASGMYVSKWNNFQQQFITYQSFTDFDNFFSYLPERAQARVEKRAEKKKGRGKENFVKTLITIHPAVSMDNGYTIVGEAFHATYRTETYTTYVNGRPTTQTRQVFDGYQYTHAVVMGIDFSGNMVYDHCFEMFIGDKPWTPRRNLRLVKNDDALDMIYCNGTAINAITLKENQISDKEVGRVTRTVVEGDTKVFTYGTGSQYWYDNYYIIYCFQRIKNKGNEEVDRKRNLFVLNKVGYTK